MIESTATFSPCRRWRYTLRRVWGAPGGPLCMFIGLNPSTADETQDDPTVRRCIRYAQSWGHSGLIMTNIFAWRDTDPAGMKAADDPIGPDNDEALCAAASAADVVVAAWGVHGAHLGRGDAVRRLLPRLHHLGLNQDGSPKHPLYLPKNLNPKPWRIAI
jgi:hypothetical protein